MNILSIDPGMSTGIAIFTDSKLSEIKTINPHELTWLLIGTARHGRFHGIVFEDSRKQSHIWAAHGSKGASALKIARNVGQIDAWCAFIEAMAEDLGIKCLGVSPKAKGAKPDKAEFKRLFPYWTGGSSQHARDAAVIGYAFRGGWK